MESISPAGTLGKIHLILVETQEPGNLGSAARAMMNMGLDRMRLVAPCDREHPDCRALAGKAYPILERAMCFESWDAAMSEMTLLVGTTSARDRYIERPVLSAREAARYVSRNSGDIGIVFGPERTGLSEASLSRCQLLATVPSALEHPVLNLAQAVMIFCYELHLAAASPRVASRPPSADQSQRMQMFDQLRGLLQRIGFLSTSRPEPIMAAIRNLFRPDLSPRDIRVMRGVLSQIEWFIEAGRRLPADRVRRK